ncbi:MAG: cell division protein ZapA [Clostridiales bacterium]|nr:cell division protein ZapA [Clostridiales bacterium]
MEKFYHKIMVSGVELNLSSENTNEYVEKLSEDLTKRIDKLEFSNVGVSKLEAAVVCALDLLDENYRLRLQIEDSKDNR